VNVKVSHEWRFPNKEMVFREGEIKVIEELLFATDTKSLWILKQGVIAFNNEYINYIHMETKKIDLKLKSLNVN
jgi:hypothetical protein